jgi:hypothetical protein
MENLKTLCAFARPIQLRRIMLGFCLTAFASPMFAQFSATGISIDPTTGAQQLFTSILHGGLIIAAIIAIGAFLYGCFRLVSGRPMEGILEIALGIIVFGLIGNALNWGTALTRRCSRNAR